MNKLKLLTFCTIISFLCIIHSGCIKTEADKMKAKLEDFITNFESKIKPLEKEYNNASYIAAVSGKQDDYQKAANLKVLIAKIYSNKESFNILKQILNSKLIKEPILKKQLDILYYSFLQYQIDEKMQIDIIMLENNILHKFSTYRPQINDKEITDNEIEDILQNSTDSVELAKYWRASKKIGREISADLIKLIKMRNAAAQQLGYKNYYEMMLISSGQNPHEIDSLFDELDMLTRGPYTQLKDEIDEYLAAKYKIPKDKLMPWHYHNRFFQEAPKIYNVNLDGYYKDKDLVGFANNYFKSIGLDIHSVLSNSDLFEKEGKHQQSYSVDIDRAGEVKILSNLKDNQYSMYTLLYEAGFSAYLKNIDKSLPYLLHQPTHFFTADAVANMFSRLSQDAGWLKLVAGISDDEKNKIEKLVTKQLRLSKFVFSRWSQVMYRFEREMYFNPDQDLNKLWWELVENYQMLKRPALRNEPDWASKTHLSSMSCTYHNYMLGELLASQLHHYIINNILNNKTGLSEANPEIGKYLIEKIFKYGKSYNWNELIYKATNDSLSPVYFTNQFINN